MNNTWYVWTFKLGDKAYKEVRPRRMEIQKEKDLTYISGWFWWKKYSEKDSGRWQIMFVYDRGPGTVGKTEYIVFNQEQEARYWFDRTFSQIFIDQEHNVPKPPIQKKKPDHLSLVPPKI